MSATQPIHEQARFPLAVRALCLVLALAFAWLTVHTLGAWITGPSFFPQAAKPSADYGWPAPLAAAAASILFLQISSGRRALSYDKERERLLVETRWLIGDNRRVISRSEIRSVRVRPLAAAVWCVEIEHSGGAWIAVVDRVTESSANAVARRLAELLERPLLAPPAV